MVRKTQETAEARVAFDHVKHVRLEAEHLQGILLLLLLWGESSSRASAEESPSFNFKTCMSGSRLSTAVSIMYMLHLGRLAEYYPSWLYSLRCGILSMQRARVC